MAHPARSAVVDLGSNSVRLVVFERSGRMPVAIFNEKAVLRLGRGLQASGQLNPEGVAQAIDVMARYHAIATAMHADPFEVLATAAVRDASNGADFVAGLGRVMPGVPIRILSGTEEAGYAAAGVLAGIPDADGTLADIGGGSLEIVRLERGRLAAARSLHLGVLRLADRAAGDLARAKEIAEADLATVPGIGGAAGRDLFLVGGAFRALARLHMAGENYPLPIVHHYALPLEEARRFAGAVPDMPRRAVERVPGLRRRAEDLPLAATVLRRVLRAVNPGRIVFSAHGLREGWFLDRVAGHLPESGPDAHPLLAEARALGRLLGRDGGLPGALRAWTAPLFSGETATERAWREAACELADTGSHDHPEFRAEQSFFRILRQPGAALDHPGRAFLAVAVAIRYDAEGDEAFIAPIRSLLSAGQFAGAERLGLALRLAAVLSGGLPGLLGGATLEPGRPPGRLTLTLARGAGLMGNESVWRRLERLALAIGQRPGMEVAVG